MSRLINEEIAQMEETIRTYKDTVQTACYEQFKNASTLTQSNNFRGAAADAYKSYVNTATINLLNSLINAAEDMATTMTGVKEAFFGFESDEAGRVDTDTLSEVMTQLSEKSTAFGSLAGEIDATLSSAGEYIAVTSLSSDTVTSGMTTVSNDVQQVGFDLESTNSQVLSQAEALLSTLERLGTAIDKTSGDYHVDGTINYDKMGGMTSESWYNEGSVDNLKRLSDADPFSFTANSDALAEDQWAAGLYDDVYGYAGYRFAGGSYEGGLRDGVLSGKAEGSLIRGQAGGQITRFLQGSAQADILTASVNGKAGFNKDYAGVHAEGKVALIDADASAVLGTDDFNVKADVSAKVLSAEGFVKCEADSEGNFAVGFKGEATAANVKASVGGSAFGVEVEGKEVSLLGAKVGGKAGGGVDASAYIESQKAIDLGDVNINATNIHVGAQLGLGFEIDLTVPTISFDWPW